MGWFLKSFTNWAAIGGLLVTIGTLMQGKMRWEEAINPILTALVALGLRRAQRKNEVKIDQAERSARLS